MCNKRGTFKLLQLTRLLEFFEGGTAYMLYNIACFFFLHLLLFVVVQFIALVPSVKSRVPNREKRGLQKLRHLITYQISPIDQLGKETPKNDQLGKGIPEMNCLVGNG